VSNQTSLVVLLLGFPATGKLTIAQLLAPQLGAIVVDNHWINNPIFGLLDTDGSRTLPTAVWERTSEVRTAVMETIATIAPPKRNFIFTYSGAIGEPYDARSYELMLSTATRRGSVFVPVRLLCSHEVLRRRIMSDDRKGRLKATDPESLRQYVGKEVFDPGHQNQLTLDISDSSPQEAVKIINHHIHKQLKRK